MSYTKPGSGGEGVVSTIVGGDGIHVDSLVPSNPVVSVDDSELNAVLTIVPGTAITVDDSDPQNPIVSSSSLGLESIQPGDNISVDSSDPLNPIISSVGGSGSAVVVDTIGAMEGYVGGEEVIFVSDPHRGGYFTKTTDVLTNDNGTIFPASGGGHWVREFDIEQGVSVKWWGATGLISQDATQIFRDFFGYCSNYWFMGNGEEAPFKRVKAIIPNGDYKWTSQIKLGGRPINETDSMSYQYTNSSAPSYSASESLIVGNFVPFSIEGGDRTFIHYGWVPTQLTALLSIGAAAYQVGFHQIPKVTISNLTFVGSLGMVNTVTVQTGNEQGLQVYGMWGCKFENLCYINLQVGEQYNASYFLQRFRGQFQNCGLGMNNTGSHSMTGGNMLADHCHLGFRIDGGASVWNQLNGEQNSKTILVTANAVTINGVYLEQLGPSETGEDYQLEVFGDAFTLNGGVVAAYNGQGIHVTGEDKYAAFKGINGSGGMLVDHASMTIYLENTTYTPAVGNITRPLSDGFVVNSAQINNLTNSILTTGNITDSGPLSVGGNTTLKQDVFLKVANDNAFTEKNVKKVIELVNDGDIILVLGKTSNLTKGDSVIGRFTMLGNANPTLIRGGYIDINFTNKHFLDYQFSCVFNLANTNVNAQAITYMLGGEQYIGIRLSGPTGAWNYSRGYFEGVYGGGAYVLTSITSFSATGHAAAVGVGTNFTVVAATMSLPTASPMVLVEGTGIDIDNSNPLAPVISATPGGTGTAAVLPDIPNLLAYSGSEQVVHVTHQFRGGMFYKSLDVLEADGGIVLPRVGGGFWVRQWDRYVGVSVRWWGAMGDGIADDILAFESASDYVSHNYDPFGEGITDEQRIDRPIINVPDGIYRLTRTWKMGGAPTNANDAQWYQAYSGSAPSYSLPEHQIAAGFPAISLIFGQRSYLLPDFGVLTELTAVVSMSNYGYGQGERHLQKAVIDGLKVYSKWDNLPFEFFGTDGPNLAGFVLYGCLPGMEIKNLSFSGLQVGCILNTVYMTNMSQFHFNRCGRGMQFIGGHGASGWMFTAYNCELAYFIGSGASAWTQLNSEQCAESLHFDGNNTTFNGIYFEQLNDYSDTHPDAYQIRIGDNSGPPSGSRMGIEINAAVITNVPFGKEIYIGTTTQDIAITNLSAYGTKYIAHADTKVTTNAFEPNFTGPGVANLTRTYGGLISTKDINSTGTIQGNAAAFSGHVGTSTASATNLTVNGIAQLPTLTHEGPRFKTKVVDYSGLSIDPTTEYLILSRTIPDGSTMNGEIQFEGLTEGGMTLMFNWGIDGVPRWIMRHEEMPYAFGLPTIDLHTFTYLGNQYYGLSFEGGGSGYQPKKLIFKGWWNETGYFLTSVPKASTTGGTFIQRTQQKVGIVVLDIAPFYIPLQPGEFYFNKTAGKFYISKGRDSVADWVAIN